MRIGSYLGIDRSDYETVTSTSRELVPHSPPPPPVAVEAGTEVATNAELPVYRSPLQRLAGDRDVRSLTPREMVDLSFDLYTASILSWDEYSMLAFQPELHPQYDSTIGALTGRRAEPDMPRDFVSIWEEKYDFERRHGGDDPATSRQVGHILAVLRQIDTPTNVIV